jgi:hypothetical protein
MGAASKVKLHKPKQEKNDKTLQVTFLSTNKGKI